MKKQKARKISLTPHQVLQIAVEARVDPRTIRRWCNGLEIRSANKDRIETAATRLEIAAA